MMLKSILAGCRQARRWLGDINLQLQIFLLFDVDFGHGSMVASPLTDAVVIGTALLAIRIEIIDFCDTGLAYHRVLIVPLVGDLCVGWLVRETACMERYGKRKEFSVSACQNCGSIFCMAFLQDGSGSIH